jgi:hypothetical protein
VEKEVPIALTGSHVWLEEQRGVRVRVQVVPLPPEPATGRAPAKGAPKQGGKG